MGVRTALLATMPLIFCTGAFVSEAAATGGHGGSSSQNGQNGQNGANGQNGFNGSNGANGANGQNGASGQNGANGQDRRDGRVTDIPVATAYAAPTIATEDTCMGSSSVGAQAMAFGVSIGTTWRDSKMPAVEEFAWDRGAVALLCVDEVRRR